MEKKINIAEILKNCPKGMELDCVLFDDVTLSEVRDNRDNRDNRFPIKIAIGANLYRYLTKTGGYDIVPESKCVIFPKGKTTWEGFQIPFKDGDIVAFDDPYRDNLQVFIFKDKKENNTLSNCYLMLDGDELDLEEGMYYVTRLATEGEKQKLFQAIKDNGYRWNAETKTLEKLVEPRFKVGDKIFNVFRKHMGASGVQGVISDITDDKYIFTDGSYMSISSQNNWELVPNKFDITTLKPFEKVLVRGDVGQKWTHDFFGFIDKDKGCPFVCVGHYVIQCIPYEGNEHLLGTTDDCDEYYKTWE